MGEFRQVWHGSTDLGWMLRSIGGWHIGCQLHDEHASAVLLAEQKGWIGRRMHYAPASDEGVAAFEITDKGIEQLREWGRDADGAQATRQWYRDNTAAPIISQVEGRRLDDG
jgi:hypothetical protein